MVIKVILLISLILLLFFSQSNPFERKLYFSPIPTLTKEALLTEYYPLISILREKTNLPIEFHYERDYRELANALKEGRVAIISAGPLPFQLLIREFPHAKPILYIKERDGSVSYTCVLFTAYDGPKSPKEIRGKIALPQRLSTCGYFSARVIFSRYGKDVDRLGYVHFDTHDAVVDAVLRGKFEAGVVKRDIAERYRGYAIRFLDESPKWPAFVLVVNTKVLTNEEIKKIKRALLNLSSDEAKKLNIGRHGFAEVDERDFETIKKYEKFIPTF